MPHPADKVSFAPVLGPAFVQPTFVTTDAELASVCDRWLRAGQLALDTEFVRERTYYPLPGLLQADAGDGVVLIDPLAVSDFAPLGRLLTDPGMEFVMHAPGEDFDLFERLFGIVPASLFDTQRAAAFAGLGMGVGYRGLVASLLGVELDKGETRSDWRRRPLTPSQLSYAALDVAYLHQLRERLSASLAALGRLAWLREDQERFRRTRATDAGADAAYLRVKGRGRLTAPDHAVLRALAAWREREAQTRNMPRRHLVGDTALVALARCTGKAPSREVRGLSRAVLDRYGEKLDAVVRTGREEGPGTLDRQVDMRPLARRVDALKRIVVEAAAQLELPPELLASRRALESLVVQVHVHCGEPPLEWLGWRRELVGERLLASLRSPT